MRKTYSKADNEAIYDKLNSQLDELVNNDSVILSVDGGKRRILVSNIDRNLPCIKVRPRKGYIEVTTTKTIEKIATGVSLGRYLLNISDEKIKVDHINRNTLDNRRNNLRVGTHGVNMLNRKPFNQTKKFKGVRQVNNNFVISVCSNKKVYMLTVPISLTEKAAAIIYDSIAIILNGDIHVTNFPKSNYTNAKLAEVLDTYWDKLRILNRK